MRISSISNFQYLIADYKKQSHTKVYNYTSAQDCFIKCDNSNSKGINKLMSRENVSFAGGIANISNEFKLKFTRTFFKKILREGITDAYSDIELVPQEYLDNIKTLGLLNKKSSIAIKAIKPYRDSMFPIEKEIFAMLETMSKKKPDLTLQELLKLKFSQAENSLIKQQSNILNKINIIIRQLPQYEYKQIRNIIQESFNKIFDQNPIPENRFRRKDFLIILKKINIKDKKIKEKILKIAEKLPSSSDNINAFIVKYSQPYKLKYNHHNKEEYIRITRDSQELGIRLLSPSEGTDDHIYAHTNFRQEFKKWLDNEEEAEPLKNGLKVTILSSRKMNELKTDSPIDDFIAKNQNIPHYIQNHINRLIEIAEIWLKEGKFEDASLLSDYIIVLKEEFALRSNIVNVDISELEKKIPLIKEKSQNAIEKKKTKRLKKTGHADNSHKEHNIDKDGNVIENRKVQKHLSRFSK